MRSRLRRALADAIKARDPVAVSALRSTLAAIDNAEVPRRALTESEIEALVQAEVAERLAAADDYERHDQLEHAGRLRREAEVIRRHLPDTPRS